MREERQDAERRLVGVYARESLTERVNIEQVLGSEAARNRVSLETLVGDCEYF